MIPSLADEELTKYRPPVTMKKSVATHLHSPIAGRPSTLVTLRVTHVGYLEGRGVLDEVNSLPAVPKYGTDGFKIYAI